MYAQEGNLSPRNETTANSVLARNIPLGYGVIVACSIEVGVSRLGLLFFCAKYV